MTVTLASRGTRAPRRKVGGTLAIVTGSLPAVSRTAVGVAALRAYESSRPDRLFDDPYAAAFAEAGRSMLPAGGRDSAQAGLGELMYPQIVIRTRFFDDYLRAAGCA